MIDRRLSFEYIHQHDDDERRKFGYGNADRSAERRILGAQRHILFCKREAKQQFADLLNELRERRRAHILHALKITAISAHDGYSQQRRRDAHNRML
ncbi:hypothetical protein SDC9_137973 [bioreactor metagenome]|uniref:Uncharacterized protein n=1 Tax=bioreactor metagenome TaxID=1076179 RepID=A0A645DN13_9ZZZZ